VIRPKLLLFASLYSREATGRGVDRNGGGNRFKCVIGVGSALGSLRSPVDEMSHASARRLQVPRPKFLLSLPEPAAYMSPTMTDARSELTAATLPPNLMRVGRNVDVIVGWIAGPVLRHE
jgi:hypothetical protein